MKLSEILGPIELDENTPPTKSYCEKTPRGKMSAYAQSNCVSRGWLAHKSKKKQDTDGDGKQEKIDGKKISSVKHPGGTAGNTPDWGGKTR